MTTRTLGAALCAFALSTASAQSLPTSAELTTLWHSSDEGASAESAAAFLKHFGGKGRPVVARLRALRRIAEHPTPANLTVLLERSLEGVKPDAETERAFAAGLWPTVGRAKPEAKPFKRVLKRLRAAKDPWLELNALRAQIAVEGMEPVAELAREGKPLTRAAALEALGLEADPLQVEALLVEVLSEQPLHKTAAFERVLVGACASAWLTAKRRAGNDLERARLALQGYAAKEAGGGGDLVRGLMAGVQRDLLWSRMLPRDRRAELGFEEQPDGWFAQRADPSRADRAPSEPEREGQTRVRARFLGATSTADHVVFVIDLSDSMLNTLTPNQREALAAVSRSGTLPRDRVRTRLDAARYLLLEALQGLGRRTRFAVIGFGDEAQTFAATPKLVKASKGVVKSVAKELSALRPGPPKPGFTQGTLRGQTNLRAALRLAFRLTTSSPLLAGSEHLAGFKAGAQAVFVFSDGLPNVWPQLEPGAWPDCVYPPVTYNEDQGRSVKAGKRKVSRVNPETGEVVTEEVDDYRWEKGATREVTVPSRVAPFHASLDAPYVTRAAEDYRRLNAFRHVELHASLLVGNEGRFSFSLHQLGYCLDAVRPSSGQLRYLPTARR